jgi:alanyl-tRNA synthetase
MEKTVRLFDADSYLQSFFATVLLCEENKNGKYEVVLDATAFFPEMGGQYADTGTLDGAIVSDARIKNGVIYHVCDAPIEIGKHVEGKIDFAARFRKMQHHTGEHIVSGIIHTLFGIENVGFHLNDECVTLDTSAPLTREQLDRVEDLANEAIYKNLPIVCEYPDPEELAQMEYRSKIELEGDVRIVTIEGVDACACCAPHVRSTAEVGIIKLLDAVSYKGGMRIMMLCGADALRDYRARYESVVHIAHALSAKQDGVAAAFDKLVADFEDYKKYTSGLKARVVSLMAAQYESTDEPICVFLDASFDSNLTRELANLLVEKTTAYVAVLSGSDGAGYSFTLASKTRDVRELIPAIKEELGGRGGGSAQMVRGSLNASEEKIKSAFGK